MTLRNSESHSRSTTLKESYHLHTCKILTCQKDSCIKYTCTKHIYQKDNCKICRCRKYKCMKYMCRKYRCRKYNCTKRRSTKEKYQGERPPPKAERRRPGIFANVHRYWHGERITTPRACEASIYHCSRKPYPKPYPRKTRKTRGTSQALAPRVLLWRLYKSAILFYMYFFTLLYSVFVLRVCTPFLRELVNTSAASVLEVCYRLQTTYKIYMCVKDSCIFYT